MTCVAKTFGSACQSGAAAAAAVNGAGDDDADPCRDFALAVDAVDKQMADGLATRVRLDIEFAKKFRAPFVANRASRPEFFPRAMWNFYFLALDLVRAHERILVFA